MCKGRAIAFRKNTSACEIVYRILENWSTGNENFVKEFEKTVDRVLENCYDGHGQRNDCGVRRLKMEKNMKSKIVVDSSANVYELPDVGFACVPLKILTDEQEYVDTAEVDAPALAEMLRTYKGRTSTSCPNISDWLTAYEGADEVYVVTITGTLSGAYNAALLAGEEYEQSHEGARVFVLDSLSTGAESRLLVERLAALIKAGKPFDTVCEEIRAYHEHTHLLFALESLANLARNGRVKPAVAAVARMLGIRVIGQASDAGDLEVLCKTRGEHGALERMVLEMKAHGLTNGRVHIDHCCNAAAAERLKHMVHAVPGGQGGGRQLRRAVQLLRGARRPDGGLRGQRSPHRLSGKYIIESWFTGASADAPVNFFIRNKGGRHAGVPDTKSLQRGKNRVILNRIIEVS